MDWTLDLDQNLDLDTGLDLELDNYLQPYKKSGVGLVNSIGFLQFCYITEFE